MSRIGVAPVDVGRRDGRHHLEMIDAILGA